MHISEYVDTAITFIVQTHRFFLSDNYHFKEYPDRAKEFAF